MLSFCTALLTITMYLYTTNINNCYNSCITIDKSWCKLRSNCVYSSPVLSVLCVLLYRIIKTVAFSLLYNGNQSCVWHQSWKILAAIIFFLPEINNCCLLPIKLLSITYKLISKANLVPDFGWHSHIRLHK